MWGFDRIANTQQFRKGPLLLSSISLVLALMVFLLGILTGSPDSAPPLQIGTATDGGTYAKIGKALKPVLEKGLGGREVVALYTRGSIDNIERLKEKKLDLALIQSDVDASEKVLIVAPLYNEYMHIIVRTDKVTNAATIKDLRGKRVAIGPLGSGSRVAVEKVLKFFHVEVRTKEYTSVAQERDALINGSIDAICRVAGLPDQIVSELLKHEEMALLPLVQEESLGGFRNNEPGYHEGNIPKGTYSTFIDQSPKVATIFVTALLVARSDLPADLVHRITKVFDDSLVEMRGNPDVANYIPHDLELNMDKSPYWFNFHPGSRASYKGTFDWYRVFPIAGYILLIFSLVIVLREGYRMWRLGRVLHFAELAGSNQDISHDVFLCYSSTGHHSDVEWISATLEQKGIRCWYAPRNIPGGREWPELIPTAIKQTEVALVLVFTEHANESDHIARELTLASSIKLKIIPYFLENAKPKGSIEYHIANVQWIEAFAQSKEKSLAQLLEAVNRVRKEKSAQIEDSAAEPMSDSKVASVVEAATEVLPTQISNSLATFHFTRRYRWLVGTMVLIMFGVALALWSFTNKVSPVLLEPKDSYILGGLTYSWEYDSGGKPGVRYEVKRTSGNVELIAKNIGGKGFREDELSGEITWAVRALVPSLNGDMVPTSWSASRRVERYKDTLQKIVERKHVVVAIEEELKRKEDTDPELMLIRKALEDHVGGGIKITTEPHPFNQLKTLFTGKDKHEFDLMAAYISVRASREREWKVKFTDPILTYPQAFVRLNDTTVCIGSGPARPCRIAVIKGTVNEELALELTKGNPEGKVVSIGDVALGYYRMYDMLRTAKVDLLLMDEPFANQLQVEARKKTPVVVNTVDEVLDDPPENEKIAIATKIIDSRLLNVLNDAIKRYDSEIKQTVKELETEPLLK